jgi:hypothetical protein
MIILMNDAVNLKDFTTFTINNTARTRSVIRRVLTGRKEALG